MNRDFKNVLVTGGSGFIGSNFIQNFLENNSDCQIVNLDKLTYAGNEANNDSIKENKNYRFIQGDINSETVVNNIIENYDIDAIVNFAAESHVDRSIDGPAEFITTNILGTFNLLKCALDAFQLKENFCFLHVSTDEVYGSLEIDAPSFCEENQYCPNSPYSASKASSDHLVRAWHHTYGLPVLTTNCSNNYGPFQFPEKLIPLTIDNALNQKEIKVYGDGKNIRDWLYVRDHCLAIMKVLESGNPGETYNIGGNNEIRNLELVQIICEELDVLSPPKNCSVTNYFDLVKFVPDRPGHDRRYAIDSSKIKNDLNWEPIETFKSGIKKTLSWYLDNLEWITNIRSGEYEKWIFNQYK